jgi:hypothetical protein
MYESPSSEPTSKSTGGESISPSVARPSNGRPCASARKPEAVLWPKPREPKVDADPEEAVLVFHEVDVVVARADRAELRRGRLGELPLRREVRVPDSVEHRVIGPLGRRNAHAERDPSRDLAHQLLDAAKGVEVRSGQVRSGGLVPASNIEADSLRRDVALVGDPAPIGWL